MKATIDNSRVLVTGGAGFIGSNLVEALLNQGNEVVCLDNFSTGKRENIAGLIGNKKFVLLEGDIRDRTACKRAADGVEYVFHEAALGSVVQSIEDPAESADVNIMGFVNVLSAARDAGAKRFVFASSSAVYGDGEGLPKVEGEIGRPLSPYAITKYANELYAANFGSLFGTETVGLRYFNVFGRRQDPHGAYAAVIPLFAKALLRHEAPTINGDGSYTRDYIYVDDVVRANQLAALAGKDAVGEVFNVAQGDRTTLNELFEYLRDDLAALDPEVARVRVKHGPFRTGDIPHSVADISKARRLLGYEPGFTVADGLKAASRWYFENL